MAAEESTNFYNPDGDDESSLPAAKAAGKDTSIAWTASEFIEHQRGPSWYLLLVVITASLAAGVYFLIHDIFAAGVIVVLGVIVGFYSIHEPGQVTYEVTNSGLKIGDKSHSYHNFKSFSIIHDSALSSVNLYPLKRFSIPISAFFDPKDEQRITNLIGEHLPLEQRKPDTFDKLTRKLKI